MAYKLKSSVEVYRNPWISVREDRIDWHAGASALFGVVEVKPGVCVLPIHADNRAVLVREYKYAIQREALEAISGGIDTGESPAEAAAREVAEETGYRSGRLVALGELDPMSSVVRAPAWMFLAEELAPGPPEPQEAEHVSVVEIPLADALAMVLDGRIRHGPSSVLVLRAARLRGL
ncbi:MAG: NUDIX hydrolase [Proteobacteria bacterium]|nr:NUDIX hydrolase [Pseudomonadota bacterium]MBI3499092.1 NUDIX hydrolase [Pseudomonadota bacterium]